MAKGSGIGKGAMWVLMGLLIAGLAGFGAVDLSGNISSVGTVGSKSLRVDDYYRTLQNEIRAIEQQTGRQLPFAEVQQIGLDRAVLQRLVRQRALDHETSEVGLSIGDEAVRQEILQIGAFQGVNGAFDREGYRFALQQNGMTEGEFETSLREEAARTLLQGAITGAVRMPESYAQTLVDYVGETRSATWVRLDVEDLTSPLPDPSVETLRSYYDANADLFRLPAAKAITYTILTPDALMGTVEVPEDALRAEYDARIDSYQQPERRLVERLVMPDQETADRAAADLDAGATRFRTLVESRGLSLADIDLGDVGRLELDAAGEAVFAAEVGDIVGPLPSPLGPALFRVNGVLPAQNITFEQARIALEEELSVSRAVRAVEVRARDLDDQLAGGATLEQLVEETEMELGTITWSPDVTDGIAAYSDFREAARRLAAGDFPQIDQLDDGSVYAMRLDEELPERPNPFDDALEDVRAAWTAEQTVNALEAQTDTLLEDLRGGSTFSDAELTPRQEETITRGGFVGGVPESFIEAVFEMAPGDIRRLPDADGVIVVRLDGVTSAMDDPDAAALLEELRVQTDRALAQDLFNIYANDVVRRAGQEIDQRALQAVHVNFP